MLASKCSCATSGVHALETLRPGCARSDDHENGRAEHSYQRHEPCYQRATGPLPAEAAGCNQRSGRWRKPYRSHKQEERDFQQLSERASVNAP